MNLFKKSNSAPSSMFAPTFGGDSTSMENAVIKPPQQSKVLEYALPAAAVLESILTGGKSPGTASLSALGNLSAGQDKYASLLKQQDTAKTSALERKAKETELGYKQTAEERAAAKESRDAESAGRDTEKYKKELEAQETFKALFRRASPAQPDDPNMKPEEAAAMLRKQGVKPQAPAEQTMSDDEIDYYSKNRGEYYKQKSAELPAPTPTIAATLKDPVLKELARQAQTSPAASKQFWTEYASKYEAQAAANAKADEKKDTQNFTEMEKIKVKVDKIAAPHIEVNDAINRARESLSAKNPVMDEVLKTSLARMSGEKGPLSDQDIARYSGSKAWKEQIKRYGSKAYSGKMTEQDRANLIQLVDIYEASNNKAVVEKALKNKSYYEAMGKDISAIINEIIPTSVPRDDLGELIFDNDTDTKKKYVLVGRDKKQPASWLEIR